MWPPNRSVSAGPGALVGNMHQRDAGGAGEIFAGDVARGAGAGRAEIDLAGIGLGIGDQFGDGFGRKRRIHHQRIRRVADQADRRKILARIVADVLVERRPDRERAGVAEHQRVAVGLAFGDRLGADGAAGAGAVVDHDLFAEQLAHLVGDAAADDRGRAARRKRNHQRDRAGRIVLRVRGDATRRDHGASAAERRCKLSGSCMSRGCSRDRRHCGCDDRCKGVVPFAIRRAYFQANTGCSSSATRVLRPASTSRN